MSTEGNTPAESRERGATRTLEPFSVATDRIDPAGTSFAGLPLAVQAFHTYGLPGAVEQHLRLKERRRGPSEAEWVEGLTMLLLSGGKCPEDLKTLKADAGLRRVWKVPQTMSPRSVLDFLYRFHDPKAPEPVQGKAMIREETPALKGLAGVNRHLVAEVQKGSAQKKATLDVDASVHPCSKRQALYSYEHCRAYQPVIALWAEQDLVVADQFRDGNVPAGMGNLEFVQKAFAALPVGIEERFLRGDSALYDHRVMRWADRDGIGFGISADMSAPLKERAQAVPEREWKDLRNRKGIVTEEGRKWAEVDFVPDDDCAKKGEGPFRYYVIRVAKKDKEPDLFGERERYRYLGVVTNRDLGGEELINWHREKCGTVEYAHDRLKNDLGVDTFPSGQFGANAAWYRLSILAGNLAVALKGQVLGGEWVGMRVSTFRYRFLRQGGRVIQHARRLVLVLAAMTLEMPKLYAAAQAVLSATSGP